MLGVFISTNGKLTPLTAKQTHFPAEQPLATGHLLVTTDHFTRKQMVTQYSQMGVRHGSTYARTPVIA